MRIYLDANGNEIGFFFWGCTGPPQMDGQTSERYILATEKCFNNSIAVKCYHNNNRVNCHDNLYYFTCVSYFGELKCSSS